MFFYLFFFFFNDTATTEIYTLSLHDALPIFIPFDRRRTNRHGVRRLGRLPQRECGRPVQSLDGWRRDVERLNGREQRSLDRRSGVSVDRGRRERRRAGRVSAAR